MFIIYSGSIYKYVSLYLIVYIIVTSFFRETDLEVVRTKFVLCRLSQVHNACLYRPHKRNLENDG